MVSILGIVIGTIHYLWEGAEILPDRASQVLKISAPTIGELPKIGTHPK